jgi:carboxylate-amine ligase
MSPEVPTVGVEEELLLVDPRTGELTAVAAQAVQAHADVEAELFLQQVETHTPPCRSLDELDREIRSSRAAICSAAESAGAAAVAVGVPVLPHDDTVVTREPRYLRIREQYGEIARSALACAMHVHVEVGELDDAVRVLDRIAPWLPVLLALSANSPYVAGRDTGHASWRAHTWNRWPSHGTGQPFGDAQTYTEVTERLVEWGAALDPAMAYFDARYAADYGTVEVRIADVCTSTDDALLVAALARALISTARHDDRTRPWRSELVRAATWRASRHGLADRLVDPSAGALAPARAVVGSLLTHTRAALEAGDDLQRVESLVERLFADGSGATHQRRHFEETGSLESVVLDGIRRTQVAAEIG